jgi:hypothetical protein
MTCPICGNEPAARGGRCTHSLEDRVSMGNRVGRVLNEHRAGRIDIDQASNKLDDIRKNYRTGMYK